MVAVPTAADILLLSQHTSAAAQRDLAARLCRATLPACNEALQPAVVPASARAKLPVGNCRPTCMAPSRNHRQSCTLAHVAMTSKRGVCSAV